MVHSFLFVHELIFGHSGLVSQIFELAFVLFLLLLGRLVLLVEVVLEDFVRLLGSLQLLLQLVDGLLVFDVLRLESIEFLFVVLVLAIPVLVLVPLRLQLFLFFF